MPSAFLLREKEEAGDVLRIPVCDLRADIEAYRHEYMEAIAQVLDSGQFIMGPNTQAFEEEAAAYLGVKHAVGVNSGTDALTIALRCFGIGPGDEVITTPFTFFATAETISLVGAKPVFVDIDPATYNIDPSLIEAAITSRTRAIIPVHLFGQAADMDAIKALAERYDLKIIEDAAQAFGGRYKGRMLGSIGDAAAFSFYPTKTLGGFGDGGIIVTDDDDVAQTARMLRNHGSKKRYYNEMIGYNSRLDEMQAAILRLRLRRLDEANEQRRAAAHLYNKLLDNGDFIELPVEKSESYHVYHQYTIRLKKGLRDEVHQALAQQGIGTMIYYPVPIHRLSVYAQDSVVLPGAEEAAEEVLSLPLWPGMGEHVLHRVAEAILSLL